MSAANYVGKAGHLAVMGELAWRKYNVAMPEIDIGDDIFVFKDDTSHVWRIQVKTATAVQQVQSNRFQYRVRESHLTAPANPSLHFVFAMRRTMGFDYVVIERGILQNYRATSRMGSNSTISGTAWVNFNIVFHHSGPMANTVQCSGVDISHHLNDFGTWP